MVFGGARGRNLVLDRLDHAPANADVALSAQRLAGVEHVAALDHEVELVVRPHRGVGASGRSAATAADPVKLRKSRRENPLMAALPRYDFYAGDDAPGSGVPQAGRASSHAKPTVSADDP